MTEIQSTCDLDILELIRKKIGNESNAMKLERSDICALRDEMEKALLFYVMKRYKGNQVAISSKMGMNRNTVRKKLRKHNLIPMHFGSKLVQEKRGYDGRIMMKGIKERTCNSYVHYLMLIKFGWVDKLASLS